MTDDIERARRILADPTGLMLPGNLGKALLERVDELQIRAEAAESVVLDCIEVAEPDLDEHGVWTGTPAEAVRDTSRQLVDARARIAELTGTFAAYRRAWAAMLPNPGRWPDTPEGVEHVCTAYAIENQRLRDEIAKAAAPDDSTKPALDRALDRLGFALDKARNGE